MRTAWTLRFSEQANKEASFLLEVHASIELRALNAYAPSAQPWQEIHMHKESSSLGGHLVTSARPRHQTPNPSLERTRNGMPRKALISFWALRVLPLRSAQLKR